MDLENLIIETVKETEENSGPKPYTISKDDVADKIYDLIDEKNHILKEVMSEFDFSNPPENPKQLATNLVGTMVRWNGVGLAAPQCYLPYRMFVINTEPWFLVLFNPRIVDTSSKDVLLKEGCLSFPHLNLSIRRPTSVRIRFQDYNGDFHTETFVGMTSRIVQHELDHLNGITFDTKVSKIQLDSAKRKRIFLQRKINRWEKEYSKIKVLDKGVDLK